ncbi:MAG TPA: GAF and ANTAR domain-containing protein [Acidimicrobiia bacterium]|nr:GAF and ANTAR domain-containing protein [Acidimicrobiia bacterium]
MARETLILRTFVALADTLVDDYDVIDFLQGLAENCVALLDVTAAGIMLADAKGSLRHAACSSEQMRLVELLELQLEQGPCFEAFRTAKPVVSTSRDDAQARWPQFAPRVFEAGFASVSAVPMRLRSNVVGALNLFSSGVTALEDPDLELAQAMADVATIGILQEQAIRSSQAYSSQLEAALDSRVVIEQAKGMLAEKLGVDVDEAFALLRRYARDHNRLLSVVARQIIAGELQPGALHGDRTHQPQQNRR